MSKQAGDKCVKKRKGTCGYLPFAADCDAAGVIMQGGDELRLPKKQSLILCSLSSVSVSVPVIGGAVLRRSKWRGKAQRTLQFVMTRRLVTSDTKNRKF